jgi:heme/copper-type cytochrome/quinol oxidase subunit 2
MYNNQKEENIMDVKMTDQQWWWAFDYLDHDIFLKPCLDPASSDSV